MAGLNDSQLAIIRKLVDTAPDTAIRSLGMALAAESEGAMAMIRDLVGAEAAERKARAMVFGPVMALCPRQPTARFDCFPLKTPALLWKALKTVDPQAIEAVMAACADWRDDEGDVTPFDDLCAEAAAGLRAPAGTPFQAAFDLIEAGDPGGAARFAAFLDLVPVTRTALIQLPDWLGRMTEERAASVRLAFRDAVTVAADAGPRFIDILIAQLDEPWLVLRVISAVMDHPGDSYMADSELAHVGERLLEEIDRHLEHLRTFDPQEGATAGAEAAEAARLVVLAIAEFEHSLELKRDGPWGARLVRQKRDLAQAVEARFNKVDDAVAAALPLKTVKLAGKLMRGVPRLAGDPEDKLVVKAEGLLAFLDQTRASAPTGGYAALRHKVVEKLENRLDEYAEDLIEELRNQDSANHDRARVYLELCARFVGFVRDEKAAQIVRRRAAA
jgi:hypothetical protein